MKRGLVMEGGAMRGMFTAGVTDVMMEHNIEFDGAIGVSAGAVFGCNFKSKQPGRVIRYNAAYCTSPHYAGLRTLVKTGDIFGEQFCYHDVPDSLDPFDYKTYRENPMEFYVVATDVNTGKPVYQRVDACEGEGMKWLRASASIPMVSNIVKAGGYELLDGGIADSLPVAYFEGLGFARNVLIATRPLDYRKEPNKMIPLARLRLRKYPNMIAAMENRHVHYNAAVEEIIRREKAGELFVIRPPKPIGVGAVERSRQKLLAAYQMGRDTMEERLWELREYLG
ncbi:MAG: patatin family protein [Blautia sp.]|nr:patatin family protein [Blautia sp.]